jgi:hypothetical protein
MKDRFEKFISENREQFDSYEPDPHVWEKVEKNIRTNRKINWRLGLKRAAIVILIFSASYAANELIHRYNNTQLSSIKPGKKENIIPGLTEAEAYYTNIVNQKMDELKPVIANCPSLQEELNYDLSELDSVYIDLKTDLKDNMANQEVIEAIIENYRLKISILEDILKEITPLGDECIPNSDGYAL